MILLAIDTSGSGCFAAIHDSDRNVTLGTAGADIGRGHAERLMEFVDAALDAAGVELSAIERIAVTIGPGSFTGIRVGVAAARGLSLALGVPAVGVSTLAAIAAEHLSGHPATPLFVAIDAKREEVYCQAFAANGAAVSAPLILPLEEARAAAGAAGGSSSVRQRRSSPGAPATISRAGRFRSRRWPASAPWPIPGPTSRNHSISAARTPSPRPVLPLRGRDPCR